MHVSNILLTPSFSLQMYITLLFVHNTWLFFQCFFQFNISANGRCPSTIAGCMKLFLFFHIFVLGRVGVLLKGVCISSNGGDEMKHHRIIRGHDGELQWTKKPRRQEKTICHCRKAEWTSEAVHEIKVWMIEWVFILIPHCAEKKSFELSP